MDQALPELHLDVNGENLIEKNDALNKPKGGRNKDSIHTERNGEKTERQQAELMHTSRE